jgi:hypothetical protein
MVQGRIALSLLTVMAALILTGLVLGRSPPVPPINGHTDRTLYQTILRDVGQGRPYYEAASAEMRADKYPTQPFLAVRPPALTMTLALLPSSAARRNALLALSALTLAAWAWRLRAVWRDQPLRYVAALMLMASGMVVVDPAYLFHEVWAGLLMALSLALHRPGRWGLSLVLGVAAALVRELAIPFLWVMTAISFWEGRKTEAGAWLLATALVLASLTAHAVAVGAVVKAGDQHSPGWLAFGGWRFVLAANSLDTVFVLAPKGCLAVGFPLALLGLFGAANGPGVRVAVIVCGFVAGLLVVGRAENTYWGLMIAPLWPLGLAWSDTALKRLLAQSRQLFTPGGAARLQGVVRG